MKRLLLLALLPMACSPQKPRTVRVGAASSLADLFDPGAITLEGGIPVSSGWSFDASSNLSRQVEAGGNRDVILSADAENVDRLGGKVVLSTRRVFLTNQLALLGPAGTIGLESIPATAKVAIAGPEVPAGKYWRGYLADKGRFAVLEGRLVNADNVRSALALFESETVDYALVFRTDALKARRANAVWSPPDGPVTEYVAAVIAGHDSAEARAFLDWLGSPWVRTAAARLGFGVPAK